MLDAGQLADHHFAKYGNLSHSVCQYWLYLYGQAGSLVQQRLGHVCADELRLALQLECSGGHVQHGIRGDQREHKYRQRGVGDVHRPPQGNLSGGLALAERCGVDSDDRLREQPKRVCVRREHQLYCQGFGGQCRVGQLHEQLCCREQQEREQRHGLFRRSGRRLQRFVVRPRGRPRRLLVLVPGRVLPRQRVVTQPGLQLRPRAQVLQQQVRRIFCPLSPRYKQHHGEQRGTHP